VPVEIPTLAGKYGRELDWEGKVVGSCVHCHQIGDAFRATYRNQGKTIPTDLIYPMPAPETIGLTLDTEKVARVTAVAPGTAAESAGLKPGDELVAVNGAPMTSIADVAWALHRAPDAGELRVLARRSGAEKELVVNLAQDWRFKTDISTRVGTWPMRAMATGGLVLDQLPEEKRKTRGIEPGTLALEVTRVGKYGPHGAGGKAGFKEGDVIVEVDGVPKTDLTESEFIGRLLTAHPQKGQVKTVVARGKSRVDLMLPTQ
jgi:S1-C subfamily serine protease